VALEGSPPVQADSFALDSDGSFVYGHDGINSGTDTFTYIVSDTNGGTDTATVTITILQPGSPVLSTPTDTGITKTSATLGATVTGNSGAAIIERGIVWATATNPTLQSYSGSKTSTGTIGVFTVSATGLQPNTTYHYRGYAKNNLGTGYTADATFTTKAEYDFGDAPSPYPTTLAQNGARHAIGSGLHLGATIDAENDGQSDDGSDEDGVNFTFQTLDPNTLYTAYLSTSGPGELNMWVDYNRDGDWEDAMEHTIDDHLVLAAGNPTVNFFVPPNAGSGTTYARFRFSSQPGLGPTGAASDGEVEDYMLTLAGNSSSSNNNNSVLFDINAPTSIDEGDMFILAGDVSDTGTLYINWGDDTGTESFHISSVIPFTRTHTYIDGTHSRTININYIDSSNESHTDSRSVTVNNVRPTISLAGSPSAVDMGATYTLTLGTITDPGNDTVTSYTIDWGDGISPATHTYTSGDTKTHIYTTAGTYTIHVDLEDEDGTHTNAGTRTVTVNDPNASPTPSPTLSPTPTPTETTQATSTPPSGGSRYSSTGKSSSHSFGGSDLSHETDSAEEDSGGGDVPLWLILVPIFAALAIGIGAYYFIGTNLEWW